MQRHFLGVLVPLAAPAWGVAGRDIEHGSPGFEKPPVLRWDGKTDQ